MQLLRKLWYRVSTTAAQRTLHVAFDTGGKDKTCVVLLHGIAATSMTWDELRYKLDYSTYRVIALDLLGFGDSPTPKHCDYTLDDHSAYVHRTLKKLGVRKPFIMVGHSMGALISTHYIAQWPEDVIRGVLVSMPLYSKRANPKYRLLNAETNFFINTYRFFRKNPEFTIKGAQALRSILKLKDGIDVRESNWEAFERSLKNSIENQTTYDELRKIEKPLTLIYGNLDEFVGKRNVSQATKALNVKIESVRAADHAINKRMASKIAEAINRGQPQ